MRSYVDTYGGSACCRAHLRLMEAENTAPQPLPSAGAPP
jgi:hypothetical protein